MILHCDTSIHPLIHPGTQQRERLLKSLIPGNLKLDDRSLAELLSFAGKLAKHIRYWNDEDRDGGDWTAFWRSDLTPLLAIIASTDIESARVMFRSKQLEYLKLKKREDEGTKTDKTSASVIIELISDPSFGIYGLALKILEICKLAPETHSIKKDIISIIETKLQQPFKRLAQFHKGIDDKSLNEKAIAKYKDFIGTGACSAPWNIKTNNDFECINFEKPYEYFEELWKLFLKFLQALNMILEKAKKAFNSSLRSRRDHQPHITLFITFLQLFRYLQSDLNKLTEKHLLFYYQDVLMLQQRRLIPDRVHIVFEIAENLERYRIKQGTLLPGGDDATGKPLFYSLQDELVAGKAKLVERKNYYFFEDKIKNEIFAFLLPAADMRDGIEEPFEEEVKIWHPLWGFNVYDRFNYKYLQTQKLADWFKGKPMPPVLTKEIKSVTDKLDKLKGISGFTISTPELWMEKVGIRIVFIELDITANGNPFPVNKNLLDDYTIEISTREGLIPLQVYPLILKNEDAIDHASLSDSMKELMKELSDLNFSGVPEIKDKQFKLNNRVAKVNNKQKYIAMFDQHFPDIIPVDDKTPPFVRFRSKNYQKFNGEINFIDVSTISLGDDSSRNKPIELPYLMQRQNNASLEIGKKFFITSNADPERDVRIKFPELFRKDLQFLIVRSAGFVVSQASLLNSGQWIQLTDTGIIAGYQFKEKESIPEFFNFNSLGANQDGWIRLQINLPAAPQFPIGVDSNRISIFYRTNPVRIPIAINGAEPPLRNPEIHTFRYFTSLGEWIPDQDSSIGFRPTPELEQPVPMEILSEKLLKPHKPARPANGNLFLGFEDLVPSQTLSLLYKTAEGTGNPDHFAPDIVWSYLKDDNWIEFPAQFILIDETLGLKQTGIIRFQVPSDINNGNNRIKGKEERTDLYWIRASATEFPDDLILVDALPMLRDIYVNAATAVFDDDDNSTEHLVEGIPATTISSLRFRDVNVKTVLQPYRSFGGRLSEKGDLLSYYQRVNERLRHKQRAVTIWDYERLTLEKFPEVALAKCLSHTRRFAVARPGYVTMAVIPFPEKMIGIRKYYPSFDTGKLEAINNYLVRYNTLFVGGYGDAEFCCCEDGCECETHRRLEVINPRFEPIRLKVCVRFIEGKDIPFYRKELNEALKNFLAPWAKESKTLVFGISITLTSLLKFLENLDYVDVVLNLHVKHFASKKSADDNEPEILWSKPDMIDPFTSASILTTYLDRFNEDNPNVVDHEINVVEKHDRCQCGSCEEDETIVDDEAEIDDKMTDNQIAELKNIIEEIWMNKPDTNAAVKDIQATLNKYVDWGLLKGEKIKNAADGQAGVHAYNIKKTKDLTSKRILSVTISIAIEEDAFTILPTIDNPHLNP